MGRKWFLIGGAAVLVVAAALYGGLVVYPDARFRAALSAAAHVLPAGMSLRYQRARYSLFSDRGVLTGVSLHATGPHRLDVTIANVQLERPSLTLAKDWQRAERNRERLRPETAIPVVAALKLTDVTIRTETLAEKITSARINGLRLYPWALLHPAIPTLTEALAMLEHPPRPGSEAAILPLLRFAAAMMLGVGNSGGDAHGITATVRIPPTPGLPAREVTYRIASTTGPASAQGIFGAGTARHIVIVLGPPVGTVTIGKLTVDGLNLRDPASCCLAASALSPNLMNGLAMGRLELAGVTAERPSRPPIALGTFTLSRFAVSAGVPVSAAFSWHGLRLTRAEMPTEQARLAFARLGLDTMTISFDAAYDWELDRDRISLQDLRLDIAELGSLSLSASLVGMTPGPDALDRARLTHAVLRYEDASLFERALRAAAAFTNARPQSFRRQMIGLIDNRANEFADDPAIAEASKAITAFIRDPHSLTIALSPPHPVDLATLRNATTMIPPALAHLLGLSVTANH